MVGCSVRRVQCSVTSDLITLHEILCCNHAGSVPLFEHVILELHSLELFLSSSLISVFNMKIRADLWHLIREVGMKCIAVAKLLIEAN